MRFSVVAACLSLCLIGFSSADDAHASIRKETNIPAEGLGPALNALAKDRNFQIVYVTEEIANLRTEGAVGEFTTEDALKRLLTGTGLTFRYLDDKTITIGSAITPRQRAAQASSTAATDANAAQEGKNNSSGGFRLAQANPGSNQRTSTVVQNATNDQATTPALSEIIVTAQKREERLRDVPMSLTALTGDELTRSQGYRFEDYVGKIPGLTVIDFGALGSQLVIRGLTTGSASINSSVATYIDETPYGGQGPYADAVFIAPNLDTFDMQRIEVLKGPQGTLYGANALGGILKYVTNAPDPSGFEARVETGANSVSHGGTGFDTHAMVNIPLGADTALRIVGYDNDYPGFIDDPSRGLRDINTSRFAGTRISLLYRPDDQFSVRLNALYQDKVWSDWPSEDVSANTLQPLHGPLVQEHLIGQPGESITQLYNLTVNWSNELLKVLSTTSYSDFKFRSISDYSDQYGPLVSEVFGGAYGAALKQDQPVEALTQEVRISSTVEKPWQWQVGGYFTNERADEFQALYAVSQPMASILYNFPAADGLATFSIPVTYREYAGFANVDYYITPTLDIGIGGRYSDNRQSFHETSLGPFGGAADYGVTSSEGVFTYSGDIRWHLTSDQMLYARVAEGFVPGGPNDAVPAANFPHSYESSTTINYEVGFKSTMLDQHLTAEVSAFDVQWRRIQLTAVIDNLGTTTNGGTARSLGLEWAFAYVPVTGLTLNLNGAYTDAYLTQDTPASVNGHAGDRLPSVPPWEMSAGLKYERPLAGSYRGFLGIDDRYMGGRYADFYAVGPRQFMPSFDIVDLRAGIESNRWSFTLYAKNVADRIAINYVQSETSLQGLGPQSATIYTPRTIGATIGVNF